MAAEPPTEDGLPRPQLATKRGRLDYCARADPFSPVLLEPEMVCSRNGCTARGQPVRRDTLDRGYS